MALGRKDVTVTRTNGGADIFRLAGLFGDDNLIRHQGLVWWLESTRPERIVNYRPTASHPLAGLRQGGKTVEKRHRVVPARRRCRRSRLRHQRESLIIRFSGSIAFRRPGMRGIGIGSGSLVSNTAVSLVGIELSQLGAYAGLGPPARLAIPPSYPNNGIFPLTGCPDRRNGTSAEQSQDEIWLQGEDIGGLKLAVAAGTSRLLRTGDDMKFSA